MIRSFCLKKISLSIQLEEISYIIIITLKYIHFNSLRKKFNKFLFNKIFNVLLIKKLVILKFKSVTSFFGFLQAEYLKNKIII